MYNGRDARYSSHIAPREDSLMTVHVLPTKDPEVARMETMLAIGQAFPDVSAIDLMKGLAALRRAGFDIVKVES